MKSFGNLLKEYIQNQGFTIYQIAKETGIDRSFLQGVIAGKRKLPQKRFSDIINLSFFTPNQIKNLCSQYYLEKYGKEKINRFELIEYALKGNLKQNLFKEYKPLLQEMPKNQYIHGQESILSAIYYAVNSSEYFASNFDFKNININRILYNACINKQFKDFFHYVNINNINQYDKMNIFFNSAHYAEIGYNTYLYENGDFTELMPYFIMTNNYMIQYDTECENAIILNIEQERRFILDKLDKIKEKCSSRVHITNDGFESLKLLQLISSNHRHEKIRSFDNAISPCFLNPEAIEAIATNAIKSIPAITNQLEAHFSLMLGEKDKTYKKWLLNFDSLEYFMKTGRICCFPTKYSLNVPLELRKTVIDNILDFAEKSNAMNIINSKMFSTDYRFSVAINDNKLIYTSCHDINDPEDFITKVIYTTDDKDIVNDLIDYIEYLSVSEKAYTLETSKDILKALSYRLEAIT